MFRGEEKDWSKGGGEGLVCRGGGKELVCMGENKDWCAGGRRRWGEAREVVYHIHSIG